MAKSQGTSPSFEAAGFEDPRIVQNELALQKSEYLNLAADFDSYKKRMRRDSDQLAEAGKVSFIHQLLPIVDNLERALAHHEREVVGHLHQGVEMTLKQLRRLLKLHGVEPTDASGQPFDPHWHEAIGVRYDENQSHHIVLDVAEKGYRHGDRLLRPAKVIVNNHAGKLK